MGKLISRYIPDRPDPRTGLTPAEKNAVQYTWTLFRTQDYTGNSVNLFLELFAQYPKYKLLFPVFSEESPDTLTKNARFIAHALAVTYQLSAIVETLDDPEIMVELVRKNAYSHVRRKGVTPVHFASLGKVLVAFFVRNYHLKKASAAKLGWEKMFQMMVRTTRDIYEEVYTAIE